MDDVLIVGAGPAGLTAAYEFAKLGGSATILEADKQVGGISRTINYCGYRFDIGGHRFYSKSEYINQLWQEILGEDLLIRPRLSRIYYRGIYFNYPLKALGTLFGLGPVETLLIGLSYSKARLFPGREEKNFEQWVTNRFGNRLYQIFFKTYTEKVWGIPCTEISADWAAQRIKNLSLAEAVRNALLSGTRSKDDEIITSLIEQFRYPRLGPGMMWECCADMLARQGNQTYKGVRVERIYHNNLCVERLAGIRKSGDREEFDCKQLISTMPLRELIHALRPAPPNEVLQAADLLRYRDYMTVVLIINRREIFPDNWLYIHSPEVRVGRIQNYKNWSPGMVPDPEHTALGLEYFHWENDEEWSWPDEKLIDLGIKECARLGLISPDEVIDGVVVRMKKAYPIYDHFYQDSLATVRFYLDKFFNLQTIGRNGLHRYNNQDHSMLTGVFAARNIAGESNDVWAVNTEQDYLEETRDAETITPDRLIPASIKFAENEEITPEQVFTTAFARLDGLALGLAIGLVCGVGFFLATTILLLKGGDVVGPNLALLSNYFWGYQVTWPGAFLGFVEAGFAGFLLGFSIAFLRNWGVAVYARRVQRREQAGEERKLLEKI